MPRGEVARITGTRRANGVGTVEVANHVADNTDLVVECLRIARIFNGEAELVIATVCRREGIEYPHSLVELTCTDVRNHARTVVHDITGRQLLDDKTNRDVRKVLNTAIEENGFRTERTTRNKGGILCRNNDALNTCFFVVANFKLKSRLRGTGRAIVEGSHIRRGVDQLSTDLKLVHTNLMADGAGSRVITERNRCALAGFKQFNQIYSVAIRDRTIGCRDLGDGVELVHVVETRVLEDTLDRNTNSIRVLKAGRRLIVTRRANLAGRHVALLSDVERLEPLAETTRCALCRDGK